MTAEEKAGVYSVGIPLEKSEMLRKMDNRPDETLCVSDALNILKGMDNISEQQAKYVGIDELGESDDLVVLGIKQPPLIPPEKVFEKTWRYGEGDTYQNRVKIVALVDLGGIREKVDEWNSSHRFRTLDCDILDIEKHPTVLRYVVASYVVEKKLGDQIDCYMKEPLAEIILSVKELEINTSNAKELVPLYCKALHIKKIGQKINRGINELLYEVTFEHLKQCWKEKMNELEGRIQAEGSEFFRNVEESNDATWLNCLVQYIKRELMLCMESPKSPASELLLKKLGTYKTQLGALAKSRESYMAVGLQDASLLIGNFLREQEKGRNVEMFVGQLEKIGGMLQQVMLRGGEMGGEDAHKKDSA